MLPPAYGILKTVLERFQHHIVEDIALIPVSITYDEVPEKDLLSGAECGQDRRIHRSPAKISPGHQAKMGRVYLRFAPFLSVKEIAELSEKRSETIHTDAPKDGVPGLQVDL
ncbi:MAG: hypothetical protein R3B54_09430 [Bdellovibrionota bacterium]